MPSETPELQLHKKDPATDGEQNFDIKTMMNDNWDKLDARALLERAHRESKSNPHNTTAAQVGAYTKAQTDTLVQEKADAAKTTAIDFTKSFGIGGEAKRFVGDVNDLGGLGTGFYYATTGSTNRPVDANGYLINIHLSASNATQLFIPNYNSVVYTRTLSGTVWSTWQQQETTAGAQSKATAAETAAKVYTDTHAANKNNPHNTTAAQVGAYTKTEADNRYETPNGAQSKATAAKVAAEDYVKSLGLGTQNPRVATDLNNEKETCVIQITNETLNTPTGSSYGVVFVLSRSSGGRTAQIAHLTNGSSTVNEYIRYEGSAGWGEWAKMETEAGAQTKANAAQKAATDWAKSFGIGSVMKEVADWNTISESGFYAATTNSPVAGSMYYGIHLERTTTHALQIVSRVGNTYTRSKENGTWQAWVLLETAAGAQAKVNAHEAKKTNPHGVTKAQVGLGSVPNYGAASQADAEAGSSNALLMTPQRTKQAIDKFAQTPPITTSPGGVKINLQTSAEDFYAAISSAGVGLHSFYAHQNVQNTPVRTIRGLAHVTSTGFAWVYGHDYQNNLHINYMDNGTWAGWKSITDNGTLATTIDNLANGFYDVGLGNLIKRLGTSKTADSLLADGKSGFFYAEPSDVTTPVPTGMYITHMAHSTTAAIQMGVSGSSNPGMWIRRAGAGVWTSWRKLGTTTFVEVTTPSAGGDGQLLTNGANNKLLFTRELNDVGNDWDILDRAFIARNDGIYLFDLQGYFKAADTYQNFELKLWKNNSELIVLGTKRHRTDNPKPTVMHEQIVSGTGIVSLKAGDRIEPWVYVGATSQYSDFRLMWTDPRFNYFKIVELGGAYFA